MIPVVLAQLWRRSLLRRGQATFERTLAATGPWSIAALATVVGVLIEVPVMLLVVRWVNASRPWYERGAAVRARMENGA